ncbi:hypothetical protein A5821_003001 [Enterococcus sp. 7F3_DIV0205]|uniref:DUF5067 domain-containing protein n=1 Tax=Candidatus Enterococcus palustris TaxID=1834189 RepID=A0AAQ3WBM0_9ENTE|nr:DUF5067 domain-containing protein [Enterococcus sp. 7F3_DIV0205]OTN83435.1 hypothetical protein A5821_003358 [Enterococcus sp. 7F3_DIV0205]
MKKFSLALLTIVISSLFLIGCTKQLDETHTQFNDEGVTYEFQLPGAWKADQEPNKEYGLQTAFSGEDTKSNSYVFISTIPVKDVVQKGFGEQTREKLKERYRYKEAKDIYMKKITIGEAPAYKYTLNTTFKEKSVWAHLYYIWTEHGFVQVTFYSADDNAYKKRSEQIDASVETFKERSFDKLEAEKEQEALKKEAGDIVTIENKDIKIETTAVRQVTGAEGKKMLAIRYMFTNLGLETAHPSVWQEVVTATQNGKTLLIGNLPQESDLLDVKELAATQTNTVNLGEQIESVVLYELQDKSPVELNFSQDAFPGKESVRVVVPG